MTILIVLILGLIQGVTEFLPVSSSGHVLVFSRLLGQPSSFEFDVLVSFGTLFAVVIYYRRRIAEIVVDIVKRRNYSLASRLLVATAPAVLIGFFLSDFIALYLHGANTAIAMLFVIGVVMVWSRRWLPNADLAVNKDLHSITIKQALFIGLAQCLALVSGSSRSGTTMLAAIRMGFKTKVAAEWSFLMSIPIIGGAALKVLVSPEGIQYIQTNTVVFIIANVVSFISGIAAIHVLLRLLEKRGLYWFGWYRIVLAVVLILLVSVKLL
jgi:undecaprenyl-diphosphatase